MRKELEDIDDIVFAYVHGSFIGRNIFRDVDVAVWVRDLGKAWYYEVDLSAKLEVKLGIPIDIHVLNQAPLPFKHHVFTRDKLLFSRDGRTRIEIVDETIRQYIDVRLLTV